LEILPHIGDMPLGDVRVSDLDRLYVTLLVSGGEDGRALAPNSVRRVHIAISGAFAAAVKWGEVEKNPARFASPPSPQSSPSNHQPSSRSQRRSPTSTKPTGHSGDPHSSDSPQQPVPAVRSCSAHVPPTSTSTTKPFVSLGQSLAPQGRPSLENRPSRASPTPCQSTRAPSLRSRLNKQTNVLPLVPLASR
jgi:hypothetical protein